MKSTPTHAGIRHIVLVPEAATLERSLDDMRTEMIGSYPFAEGVFIGGMQGVEREYDMFRRTHPNANLVPVASTGAAAAIIFDTQPPPPGGWDRSLKDDRAYLPLFRRLLRM